MNTAVVSALIAKLTAGCGLVLLLPLLTALFWEEPVLPFIHSMALCFLLAAFLRYKGKKKSHQSESPRRSCGDRAVMDMYFHSLPFPLFPVRSPFSAGRSGRKHFRPDRHRRHHFCRFNRSAEKHSFLPLPDPLARRPGNHRHLCGSLPAGRKRKRPHD